MMCKHIQKKERNPQVYGRLKGIPCVTKAKNTSYTLILSDVLKGD